MGKSSSGKMRVAEYRISLHFGIASMLDGIKDILIGEKSAWSGDVRDEAVIQIQQPNLFGGIKEEGGACGLAFYLPGGPNQTICDGLASRWGKTAATSIGYRGISSVMFVGNPGLTIDGEPKDGTTLVSTLNSLFTGLVVSLANLAGFKTAYNSLASGSERGFYMAANNPYLKTFWIKGWRAPKGLNPLKAMIGDDANGAHIIYECLTNTDWGLGGSSDIVDVDSFEDAGDTLFNETFGLSMIWTRQTSIESFIGEVLNHVQGVLYISPRTGLFTLKLLRNDYVLADLRTINASNATLSRFQRKSPDSTTNEIVVTYTNPENEEPVTTTAQDLANIAMQGGEIVSDARNFYGVHNPTIAAMLAERELTSAASLLASADVDLDRTFWDIVPGQVFKLVWPEYGTGQVIMRATSVDYGQPGSSKIRVSLVEDVFSASLATYVPAPDTSHSDGSENPTPMTYTRVITSPLYLTVGQLDTATLAEFTYPEAITSVLGAQPGSDTTRFELYGETTDTLGGTVFTTLGLRGTATRGTLVGALAAGASSSAVTFTNRIGVSPGTGWFVLFDSGNDATSEIAQITDITDSGLVLNRGLMDTVPRAWSNGDVMWFLRPDALIGDTTVRSAGETATYRYLSRTSRGILDINDAPDVDFTLTERPHLPLRPTNISIAGSSFGGTIDANRMHGIATSWSRRNRESEASVLLTWSASDVTPEAGQTTTIKVYNTATGALLTTHAGITGTSFTIPLSSFARKRNVRVDILSTRDGLDSFQTFSRNLTNVDMYRALDLREPKNAVYIAALMEDF